MMASRRPSPPALPKEKAAILVDEQFGAAILRDAAAQGYATACPAEKSGQDEFDFEYGEDFAERIEELCHGGGGLLALWTRGSQGA